MKTNQMHSLVLETGKSQQAHVFFIDQVENTPT